MIEVIAEHSVDMSLLPERGAKILDAGCLGFEFTNYMRAEGHYVCAIDCQSMPGLCMKLALTNYTGECGIRITEDKQATTICPGNEVPCVTIEELSEWEGVDMWDLIKLDIEGSEYEVIMSMDKPYAKQISVELHLHTGVYGISQVKEMEKKLCDLGYVAVQHEMTRQHGLGLNFWGSLWIFKP